MRVVLIHRYFWPDTPPYAHILRTIATRLGEEGHDVTVLTCQPSYNRAVVARAPKVEQLAPGVTVRRWPVLDDRTSSVAKVLNLLWFCLRVSVSGPRIGGADVVMAASAPPVAVAKAAALLARLCGARFVYHKQDIYPDVAVAGGLMRPGRMERLLRVIDARTDRAADRVVVLSDDMAATEIARGVSPERLATINNFDPWTDDEPQEPIAPTGATDDPRLHVVFAGNLGRFQGLPTLMQAVHLLADEADVAFDFIGEGALRRQLENEAAGLSNVTFHGYQSPVWVADFLRRHRSVGVVSVEPGVIRAAYPSKTLSYLKNGCPILAVVEADSELARQLEEAGAGWQVEPGDPEQIAAAVRKVSGDTVDLAPTCRAVVELYRAEFLAERRLDDWVRLFSELASVRAEVKA